MRDIEGERQIISDWVQQYSDDLYRFLIYKMGSHDVEDLVQETFIKAINGLHAFKGDANPKTWLLSIARNVAIDELRRRKRQKWKEQVSYDSSYDSHSEQNPEADFLLNEHYQLIQSTIREMKTAYRDVLILRGIQEMAIKETAEILNWTEAKVQSTYYRARKVLQERIGGAIREAQNESFR